MSVGVRKTLDELQNKTQSDSLTEVIRRALWVYDFLVTHDKRGAKLVMRTEDGHEETVKLFP